ncbi:putative metalloprotease with PDZ domain [Granulicella aggregans]|uniref:Putative metalloprotease with PDZ domain n=1 Tax=Granulicella aggregans TaxID=474949 RepID=A0A7W8E4F2_9BACT|nr:M61 family metallopeptidase [Granulicella aggregans]MBB5058998.1 putative metalloprotease with PDZ domain [Granulicella aggregans]
MHSILKSAALLLAASAAAAQTAPIRIAADLTDTPRKVYHAEIDIPVKPGPVTLTTPQWIPGTHRPTPLVDSITGVVFTAEVAGTKQTLVWRRDDVNMYEYHVTVPKGATSLHAHLDLINPGRQTTKLASLEWEGLLLYPAGIPVAKIAVEPTVIVPKGWGVGTALSPVGSFHGMGPGDVHKFAATTVEQLEDSPVDTGLYYRQFALAPEISPKHFLDVVADEPDDVNIRPATLAEINNLVREADAMYKSHHYNEYHLLLTLTDATGGMGLEHGQSSDNGINEKGFSTDEQQLGNSDLLAHEFTHSWNGKYRRPARLYQPDFATAQQGDLLWVYEGMTQYLGNVLAARSGLKNQQQYREILALSAANLDYKSGRQWRSTEDTAIASSILRGGTASWSNWKRGQDYYQEGELLWLDADTLIRKLTDNKKSLNDFEAIFLAKGGNTGPLIVPYERPELIADLNQVVAYDWATFLHERIDDINPHADLAGIERGGYKLVYNDQPSQAQKTLTAAGGRRGGGISAWYSLGINCGADGTLTDVRWGGPADKAKLAPGQKIYAVDGRTFSGDNLKAAIKKAKGTSEPIHLILEQDGLVTLADINYHDGERYPTLVRVEGTPAYMDDITKPLTTAPTK